MRACSGDDIFLLPGRMCIDLIVGRFWMGRLDFSDSLAEYFLRVFIRNKVRMDVDKGGKFVEK